mgnify:CR=1 FL=1
MPRVISRAVAVTRRFLGRVPLCPDSLNWSPLTDNAGGGNRTHKGQAHTILSRARLPVPPLRHQPQPSIGELEEFVKSGRLSPEQGTGIILWMKWRRSREPSAVM